MTTANTAAKHAPLEDLRARPPRPLVDGDERFHTPASDAPHWTETSWWAFTIPSTGGGGWVYLQTRPLIGLVGLGVWVWDTTSTLPWESAYSKQFHHIPLPTGDGADYTHLVLPEYGFELECLSPFQQHRIRYVDGDQIDLDLTFEAKFEPRPLGINDATGHLDQALWATGRITADGREISVDGAAFRDRTWSDRFDNSGDERKNCYVWGVAPDGTTLHTLAIWGSDGSAPEHFGGTLRRRDDVADVVSFERACTRRHPSGEPAEVQITIGDDQGRQHVVVGTVVSCNQIAAFPGYLCYSSTIRWDWDGVELWGEDHETWPYQALRSVRAQEGDVDPWSRTLR